MGLQEFCFESKSEGAVCHVFVKGISNVDNLMGNLMPWCFKRDSGSDLLAAPVWAFSITQLRAAAYHHSVSVS